MASINEKTENQLSLRILGISGVYSADKKKVHTSINFSDISRTASIELSLVDARDVSIAKSIILGIIDPGLNFTLHKGKVIAKEPISLICRLLDEDSNEVQKVSVQVADE